MLMNALYIDGFGLIGGLVDIKIDLQVTSPIVDEKRNVVGENREVAQRITLSMPMAKELAEKLTQMVSTYEQRVGPILSLEEIRERIAPTQK